MKLRPLFMWAGGKTKMIPQYEQRFYGLPYGFARYVEPFFGGGAMFCSLHNQGLLAGKMVRINDMNPEVIKLYRTIRADCEGLIYVLKCIENLYLKMDYKKRKEHYYLVRNAYAFQGFESLLDSATFLFLVKTGFNGIFQTMEGSDRFASPCGLLNHTDSLFDYDLIREWSKALHSVIIDTKDWSDVARTNGWKDNTFFFLDPPYRDCFKHYGVDEFDHSALIKWARDLTTGDRNIVFLCNRWTDDTYYEDRIGKDLDIDTFDVTYTAGRRKKNEDGTHSAVKAQEVLLNNTRRL